MGGGGIGQREEIVSAGTFPPTARFNQSGLTGGCNFGCRSPAQGVKIARRMTSLLLDSHHNDKRQDTFIAERTHVRSEKKLDCHPRS